MSLYTDATKEIIESILSGVKDGIEELSNGDKTFKARIVELTSPAKCKVLYNGVNYTVISNVYCEVGDLVRVCAPCNNWKDLYVTANLTKGKTLKDLYNGSGGGGSGGTCDCETMTNLEIDNLFKNI